MIVEPKIRNNICVTAHPLGCAAQVRAQLNYVKARDRIESPKRVLVIGASNGYGLAARIVSTFSSTASTIGVAYCGLVLRTPTLRAGSRFENAECGLRNAESYELPA